MSTRTKEQKVEIEPLFDQIYKKCPDCKNEFPKTNIYFYKCNRYKDGFSNWCKKCFDYWKSLTHDEKIIEKEKRKILKHQSTIQNLYKKCTNCKEIINKTEFYINKKSSDGYLSICKKCFSIKNKIRRKNNSSLYKERERLTRLSRKSIENKQPLIKIGQCFGQLTVIVLSEIDKHCNNLWLCRCTCGQSKKISTFNLQKRGDKNSCGCIKYYRGKKIIPSLAYNEITGNYWSGIKKSARRRKLSFNINQKEVWDLYIKQNKTCYFSGIPISFKEKTASIDRLDSNYGYESNNIAIVHKQVNFMKQSMSVLEFFTFCKLITNNLMGKMQ